MYDIAIIGAGASGLAAGIAAGQAGKRVILLERLPRAGKKILATGNGRCNLGNRHAPQHSYHNNAFAAPALAQFSAGDCAQFFDSLGLALTEDSEGRLYPRSNTAASVLNALRFGVQRFGAELCCDCPAERIRPMQGGFQINKDLRAQRVILAAGGCAAPAQGSDGSGFALLRTLGHRIVTPRPALVQLRTASSLQPMLKGMRVQAGIAIMREGQVLRQAAGEVLFTQDGLSGIAAMEVSRDAAPGTVAVLDLLPDYDIKKITALLTHWQDCCKEYTPAQLLAGLLPGRVAEAAAKSSTDTSPAALAAACKHFAFPVIGTRGFDNAQVTAGGADIAEFDPHTMQSRLVPGLYACGEALDVDGGCGGFNLHWAWASGVLAGTSAAT